MIKHETLRVLVRDTFVTAVCLWAVLYAFDAIKPGFASNYISLPRMLVFVVLLAVWSLSLDPMTEPAEAQEDVAREPSVLLFVAYGLIFIATCLALGLSVLLTLGLAFVTLLALWAIRLEWKNI